MANVSVFDMQGKEVGKMDLNDAVFGVEINEHLLHLAVVAQLANKRQGTQKALTRAEVSGGGRKPWRQVMQDRAPSEHRSGRAAELYSHRHHVTIQQP